MAPDDDPEKPHLVTDQAELVATLEDLKRRFESGELASAAMRVYLADGTFQDLALGFDTDEEATAAIARLQATMARAAH